MKKHKIFAALSAMLMALALTGCQQPSSDGSSSSGESGSSGFVKVTGTTITGTETWTPASDVFVSERELTIPDLYVCDHEVTQKEYETYCSYTGSNSPSSKYGDGDSYPVYNVSWYDALVYCNKRSLKEGLTPCYTVSGSTDTDAWGTVLVRAIPLGMPQRVISLLTATAFLQKQNGNT